MNIDSQQTDLSDSPRHLTDSEINYIIITITSDRKDLQTALKVILGQPLKEILIWPSIIPALINHLKSTFIGVNSSLRMAWTKAIASDDIDHLSDYIQVELGTKTP